jgi:hypothetical protein
MQPFAGPPGGIEPANFGHPADGTRATRGLDGLMEKTTPAPPPPDAKPTPPATAPPELRTIQRRWPRTVPETRVFPRG